MTIRKQNQGPMANSNKPNIGLSKDVGQEVEKMGTNVGLSRQLQPTRPLSNHKSPLNSVRLAVFMLILSLIGHAQLNQQFVQAQQSGNNKPEPAVATATATVSASVQRSPQALKPQAHPLEPQANTYVRKTSVPDTLDIIKQRGFIGERYRVRSSYDGQPLVVYHMINPLADPTRLHKYPVLVSHGMGGDTSQMLARSGKSRPRKPTPGKINFDLDGDDNIAFTLANNNFDVWLRDARGVSLQDHEPNVDIYVLTAGARFWNFTLDEQAQYDTPTQIDFVLEQTQTDKLHYIGFSESTEMIFALMSWQPKYQDKLATVVCMAPIAYFKHGTGLVVNTFLPSILSPDNMSFNSFPQWMVDSLGYLTDTLCSRRIFAETSCWALRASMFGVGVLDDAAGFGASMPHMTSLKSIKHFIQLLLQRRFGMYDYGTQGNMVKYGRPTPPDYNLRNIVTPRLVLIRGGVDFLSRTQDQRQLIDELGTKPYLDIFLPDYSHINFLLSKTILRDVNMPIVKVFFQHLKDLNPKGDIYRNASRSRSPAYNPLAKPPFDVARPDGTKQAYEQKSMLFHNIVRGLYGSENMPNPEQKDPNRQHQSSLLLNPLKGLTIDKVPAKALDSYAKFLDRIVDIPDYIFTHII